MKVIIIGTAYPYRGGIAAYTERLAREYRQLGHEVVIYTFTLQYPSFLFPGKTQYSSEPAPVDLTIERMINSVNPFNWLKAGRRIKKEQPDMIIFCYWMAFFAPCFGTVARIARTAKTSVVALIHNMIPHEPTIIDKLLPRFFVNAMDGFVAMSDFVIKDIEHFDKHNKPKLVSPHPIYDHYGVMMSAKDALKYLELSEAYRYVLFFGFIRQYKGLDLLLKAFADERVKALPVKLIVAGEFYENEQFYLDLIRRLQLEETVELRTSFIPDSEVQYYFNAADIVAQPYRSATQSGVTQIAYHFEKPMLVTDVGGLSEIVPNGKVGYVVEPNEKEIADALVDFYSSGRADDFAEHIKAEKKKYMWSCMVNTLGKLKKP